MKNLKNLTSQELVDINGGDGLLLALAIGIVGSAIYDAIKDPKGTIDSIEKGFNSTIINK